VGGDYACEFRILVVLFWVMGAGEIAGALGVGIDSFTWVRLEWTCLLILLVSLLG